MKSEKVKLLLNLYLSAVCNTGSFNSMDSVGVYSVDLKFGSKESIEIFLNTFLPLVVSSCVEDNVLASLLTSLLICRTLKLSFLSTWGKLSLLSISGIPESSCPLSNLIKSFRDLFLLRITIIECGSNYSVIWCCLQEFGFELNSNAEFNNGP